MTQRNSKPAYAKMDPAHFFDGLFVPTRGKERGRLKVPLRRFGDLEVGFQGFEQLGADDQSILLAITGQLGINGLVIGEDPEGQIGKDLRTSIMLGKDDGSELASKRTSLRSILVDAGYKNVESGRALAMVKESLNRLANAQIREVNKKTGWDRRCNLISVRFNHDTGEIFVAANPRLTGAVFRRQYIKISMFERNILESEVAKILHAWLCSNIRLGHELGNGNGAHLDTLAPHVWGEAGWNSLSKQGRCNKRSQLKDSLFEIYDGTKVLHNGYGWSIDITGSGIVLISRPDKLPHAESELNLLPSQFNEGQGELIEGVWVSDYKRKGESE